MKKLALLFALLPGVALAQAPNPPVKPELTELWTPVPRKVAPGPVVGQPPSDSVILFNGRDLDNWEAVAGGKVRTLTKRSA